jgi:hypothetical protein
MFIMLAAMAREKKHRVSLEQLTNKTTTRLMAATDKDARPSIWHMPYHKAKLRQEPNYCGAYTIRITNGRFDMRYIP